MKYSSEKTDEICKYLETGMNREDAWILADITESTFYKWLDEKSEFSESIKKAETKNKQRSVIVIQNASKQSWQAAAWWLERKYPEEFALKQRLEHMGRNGGPIATLELSEFTDADCLETILESYEEYHASVKELSEGEGQND